MLALVLTGWALTNQYQETALRRLGHKADAGAGVEAALEVIGKSKD